MLTRLWWKEARQFLPIWITVALTAMFMQWMALEYLLEARRGAMLGMALGMTCLYALVVTAAAFAGERESRTMGWLDAQALPRRRLWEGKASFAMVSTLALAGVLLGIAALFSGEWKPAADDTRLGAVLTGAAGLLEVLGWGLLWSAVCGNALLAGALGVLCATMFTPYFFLSSDLTINFPHQAVVRLLVASVTIATSALVVIKGQPPRAALGLLEGFRFSLSRTSTRADCPATFATPVSLPTRSWRPAAASLAWLTFRQARSVWWLLVLLAFVLPVAMFFAFLNRPRVDQSSPLLVLLNLVVALIAGVTVFGADHVNRTHRVLANQGTSPWLVWLVKNVVWLGVLGLLWLPFAVILALQGWAGPLPLRQQVPAAWYLIGALAVTYALAQLCGQAIPRAITAALIAVIAAILLAIPLGGLASFGMLPLAGPLWIAVALLIVTWLWTRDWLHDRLGYGRWPRLAAYLATASGLLVASYIYHRAYSLPEVSLPTLDQAYQNAVSQRQPAPALNAAPLYQQAFKELLKTASKSADLQTTSNAVRNANPSQRNLEVSQATARWLEANEPAMALLRQAVQLPVCRFEPLEGRTLFDQSDSPDALPSLGPLAHLSAQAKLNAGDLEAAWNDLLVSFKMVRHFASHADRRQVSIAQQVEQAALGLAMTWAVAPGQTPGLIRQAIESYRVLPPMPPVSEAVGQEYALLRQTLDMPLDQLREQLIKLRMEPRSYGYSGTSQKLWADLVTTQWERTRAQRAFRLRLGSVLAEASRPPHQRVMGRGTTGWPFYEIQFANGNAGYVTPEHLERIVETTPLVNLLFSPLQILIGTDDLNEVSRRALVQILALRGWQLEHEGRLPERLDQLVPAWLDSLPIDPYSGTPFHYVPSGGQSLLSLASVSSRPMGTMINPPLEPTTGYRLLYSLGPDRQDQGAVRSTTANFTGDIVFPIPDHDVQPPGPPGEPGPSAADGDEAASGTSTNPPAGSGLGDGRP